MTLEFLILTACRTSEVRLAVWDEIDLENRVWTIPKERMEAGREHRVLLNDRCIEILDDLSDREGYVFKKLSSGKPLGDGAFRALMERMGAGAYTPHGFRSSFRDWAAETQDTNSLVVETCLAHSIGNDTELAYLRSDFMRARSSLILRWAGFMEISLNVR